MSSPLKWPGRPRVRPPACLPVFAASLLAGVLLTPASLRPCPLSCPRIRGVFPLRPPAGELSLVPSPGAAGALVPWSLSGPRACALPPGSHPQPPGTCCSVFVFTVCLIRGWGCAESVDQTGGTDVFMKPLFVVTNMHTLRVLGRLWRLSVYFENLSHKSSCICFIRFIPSYHICFVALINSVSLKWIFFMV